MKFTNETQAYTHHIQTLLEGNNPPKPFFVTTSFHDISATRHLPFPRLVTYIWQSYTRIYRHIASKLSRNFSKKPHLQPLTFDFIDLPNTRHTKFINLDAPSTPHIHSIYLVHPDTLTPYGLLEAENFKSICSHPTFDGLHEIHSEPIDHESLAGVIDYAGKLLKNPQAVKMAGDAPLFAQYPLARFERSLH